MPCFFVQDKKTFVMFADNHHGDGRDSRSGSRRTRGARGADRRRPGAVFPAALRGRAGVGVLLAGRPDWDDVAALIEEAYRAVAPVRLVARTRRRGHALSLGADGAA